MRRAIGLVQATAMVVGIMIGASIFVQPSEITGKVHSIAGVLAVWALSGVLTFMGALVCAELASRFVQSGGVYVYLREGISPVVGFLWGWAMFWSIHSGIIAAIAVIFARYSGYFFELSDISTKAVAIAAVVALSAVNYFGVRQGSALQTIFTIGKVAAIILIAVLGFVFGARLPGHFVEDAPAVTRSVPAADYLQALLAGLFAFGGWHMVTYSSEETINPGKTIPRALMFGTMVVTACYIATNAVYMYILPLATVASSSRIAADAADALIGFGGGAFMSGLVMFSTLGALSGLVLCGPRVYHAMARDGLLFAWIGATHPRFNTPHKAIVLQALWSSVLVSTGSYRTLFTRVVYTEWLFFALLAIGLIVLRRRVAVPGTRTGIGHKVFPMVFAAAALGIVANQAVSNPAESMIGLSIVLLGLPAYCLVERKRR